MHSFFKNLVKVFNEVLVSSNEVKKTFRNKYTTIVLALLSSLTNDITNSVDNIDKGLSSV